MAKNSPRKLIECHYQESQTNFLAPDLNDKMEILYFLPFDLIVISFCTVLLATSPESSEKKSGLIVTFVTIFLLNFPIRFISERFG